MPSSSSSSSFVAAVAKPWQPREERAVGQHRGSAQCFSPSQGGAEAPQVFPCRLLFGLRDGVGVTLIIVSDFLAAGKWRHAETSERRARNRVGGEGSSGLGGSRKFAHGPARTLDHCLWRMRHCSLRQTRLTSIYEASATEALALAGTLRREGWRWNSHDRRAHARCRHWRREQWLTAPSPYSLGLRRVSACESSISLVLEAESTT